MKFQDRFDSLIQYYCAEEFPEIDWLIVKAQISQESAFRTDVVSSAGCMGLMQISRGLAIERLGSLKSIYCTDINLQLGIQYLKEQYDHFPEIPMHHNKLMFALASYNCGRGYVNMALRIARRDEGVTHKHMGLWQSWSYTSPKLRDPRCIWRAKRPDSWQVLRYVEKVMGRYAAYLAEGEGAAEA